MFRIIIEVNVCQKKFSSRVAAHCEAGHQRRHAEEGAKPRGIDASIQFFLLVRDKRYEEAYALGTMYLQFHPENQAIQQFCSFIKNNREECIYSLI
jgi:hypothetical protein